MAKKRKNGEGTWGKKTIRGIAKATKTKDSIRKISLPDKAMEAILYFRKYRRLSHKIKAEGWCLMPI